MSIKFWIHNIILVPLCSIIISIMKVFRYIYTKTPLKRVVQYLYKICVRFIGYWCNVIGSHENQIEELRSDIIKKDKSISYLESICDRLEKTKEDLSQRLSAEMVNKDATDQCFETNWGMKNTPMNVKAEFELICNNEWSQAKTVCDQLYPETREIENFTLLYNIMMLAEKQANRVLESQMYKISEALGNPFKIFANQIYNSASKTVKLPTEILNTIGDYLRDTSDSVDIMQLEKTLMIMIDETVTEEISKNIWKSTKDTEQMQAYINKLLHLTWKMVIQQPKMRFYESDDWFGENYQDLFNGSVKPVTDKVDKTHFHIISVWPILYHGKNFEAKGKVFIHGPEFMYSN